MKFFYNHRTLKAENSPLSIVYQYDFHKHNTSVAVLGTKTGWVLDIGNTPSAFTTGVFFPMDHKKGRRAFPRGKQRCFQNIVQQEYSLTTCL